MSNEGNLSLFLKTVFSYEVIYISLCIQNSFFPTEHITFVCEMANSFHVSNFKMRIIL